MRRQRNRATVRARRITLWRMKITELLPRLHQVDLVCVGHGTSVVGDAGKAMRATLS